jgi:hypothetical protein
VALFLYSGPTVVFPLMSASSAAQTALIEVLRQRLAAADCPRGRFDISEPGPHLSFSGEKPNGSTVFFWEFGHVFRQLVDAFLTEQYDADTARLSIQLDVASAQVQVVRTPKLAPTPTETPHPTPPLPDETPYGPTLAAQVAARLDQGAHLAPPPSGGMSLAREATGTYAYGEVCRGAFAATRTFATWAAFVAWLAAQSDYSLALLTQGAAAALTRQQLAELVQQVG